MINLIDVSKSFGDKVLFDDLNLALAPKERLGLVGRNGNGKTTLFKMITGEMGFDKGQIITPKNYKIGYLKQHIDFTHNTLIDEAASALEDSQKYDTWRAEKVLFGLGFSKDDLNASCDIFSGGYKIRINLAKVLLSNSNLLLLDEPNNYLDIVAIRWLEGFLRKWPGELILITHDRAFMDSVITHCAIIHRNKVRRVEGKTDKLYEQIEKEELIYEKTRLNSEKKIKQTQDFIRRFRAKATLAAMVQSRVKALEKQGQMERLEKIADLDFSFTAKDFPAARMMGINNLCFGYDKDKPLIKNLSLDVLKRDRICIIGKNGKGKSTLLEILAGKIKPDSGSVKVHPDLLISYFAQITPQELNPSKTVVEEIMSVPGCLPQRARGIAGAMMFAGDDALKPISVLSGGEKARVSLGKILARPSHLLLLDEPTNHLDMQSCEALIEAIREFDGSVIMVSHDEHILYSLAEKLIIFDGGGTYFFDGGYQDFIEQKGWADEALDIKIPAVPKTKADFEKKKKQKAIIIQERSAVLNSLKKEIQKLEQNIFEVEEQVEKNNESLIKAAIDKDIALLAQLPKDNKALEASIEQLYTDLASKSAQHDDKVKEYDKKLKMLESD